MSKVEYTVKVDEYVCTALEYIRQMHSTRDYSSLMATVERLQFHANNMEEAITAAFGRKWRIRDLCENDELSDGEFREKVKKVMQKSTD